MELNSPLFYAWNFANFLPQTSTHRTYLQIKEYIIYEAPLSVSNSNAQGF